MDQSALPGKMYGAGSTPVTSYEWDATSFRSEAEQAFSAEASEARGTPTNRIILGRTLPGHAVSRVAESALEAVARQA